MSPATRERSAIVLAGGASRRFGQDKLAVQVRGRPMLEHAILAVAAVARDVLVVGSAGPAELPDVPHTQLRRRSDDRPGAGPLAALATALPEARHASVLVVAGDMPDLAPPVLELLAATLERDDAQAAVLEQGGQPRPLPAAIDRHAGAAAAGEALANEASSLRALLDRLSVTVIDEAEWRLLDPDGASLRDIDRAPDLPERPETERRPRSRRASCGR